MALSGIPIDPQQCIGDSLEVLNNSFIELDSRTLNLSAYIGGASGNLYTTIQDVSGNLYTLIQQTSSEGGLIVPVKFSFTGNGSQDTFGLTGTSLSNDPVSYRVTLNGVVQDPGVDFNISGTNLVFTSPPPAGITIVVVTADEFGNVTVTLSGGDYQLRSLSATWNNTSTVVQTNSAQWASNVDTGVRTLSSNWQSTYTNFSTQSANNTSVYSNVQSNSATWNAAGASAGADVLVRALTGNWQNTYTNVLTNSASWGANIDTGVRALTGNYSSVYSNVQSNSATYATISFANSKFFPLSGGTITGATRVNANLTIAGNLSATGTSYFANTVYSTTSALSVINIGNTGPALYVGNNGTGDIASFYDLDQNVEILHVGGNNGTFPNVGIKTSTPGETLTVNGTISASGLIYSQGGVIKPLSGVGGIVVNNNLTNVTVVSSNSTFVSDTPPSKASAGDLWFDSSSGVTSVYYDGTWVDVGGGDSGTSAGSVNGIVQCDGNGNFSAAGPFAFRNKIINGNFDIWQRGTSLASGTGARYLADRFTNGSVTTTNTPSQQAFGVGQTDVPNQPDFFHRTVVSSGSVAGCNATLHQHIESVKTFAGKTVTLSFWAKATTAPENVAIEFHQYFGTGGSTAVSIPAGLFALTTSWQKFTVTANIPNINGKTIGASNDDYLTVYFWFDAGANFAARASNIGYQSGTFDIAQVQLEEGSVATPFEHRPIGTELALCQRYFHAFVDEDLRITSYGLGGADVTFSFKLPVTMRSVPTITQPGNSFGDTNINGVPLLVSTSPTSVKVSGNVTSTGSFSWANGGTAATASAEL